MEEGERQSAGREFLQASTKAICTEIGDQSLLAEAVTAVAAR